MNLELIVTPDSIVLTSNKTNSQSIIKKSEILKILHVHSIFSYGYLSPFSYLVLYTNDKMFVITYYTIDKVEFFKHLGDISKVETYEPWFPTIKKRFREGVMN